jgi:hypothetical protein
LVAEKVRERLVVSKQAAQERDTERFNLEKLNVAEVKEQYQVTITNNSADLENLRIIRTSIGHGTSSVRTPQFWPKRVLVIVNQSIINHGLMRQCSKLDDQRNQIEVQWLQDPSEVNEGNLSNVWWEASGHFRKRKGNI